MRPQPSSKDEIKEAQRNTPKHQHLPWQYHINVQPDEVHQSGNPPTKPAVTGTAPVVVATLTSKTFLAGGSGTVMYRETSLNPAKPSGLEAVDI